MRSTTSYRQKENKKKGSCELGWLSGWTCRKSHVIESATGAGTDYQIRITVHYGGGTDSEEDVYCNSHCKTDFGDIRFTDDDGVTLLNYWMETKVDSNYAIFWVKIADDLSSSDSQFGSGLSS